MKGASPFDQPQSVLDVIMNNGGQILIRSVSRCWQCWTWSCLGRAGCEGWCSMNSTCPMWCLGTGGKLIMTINGGDADGDLEAELPPGCYRQDQAAVPTPRRSREGWEQVSTAWKRASPSLRYVDDEIMFFVNLNATKHCIGQTIHIGNDQLSGSSLLVTTKIIFCSYNRKAVLNARSWLDRRSRSPTSPTLSTPSLSSCRTSK